LSKLSSLNAIGGATTYIFSVAILMVSIPVFSIIVRNNLVQNKICGYKTATFFSHVLPWICVLPFQTGSLINSVINWTSLFFVSTANFIIPILIYLKCLKFKKQIKISHYFTPRQRELLRTIHWQSKKIQGFIDTYPTIKLDKHPVIDKKQIEKEEEEVSINSENNNDENDENQNKNLLIPNIYVNNENNEATELFNNQQNDEIEVKKDNSKYGQYLTPPAPAAVTQPMPDISNTSNISSRPTVFGTLPTHPLFISNYYKGIPDWIPCSQETFAKICLYIIVSVIIVIIGINIQQNIYPTKNHTDPISNNEVLAGKAEIPEEPLTNEDNQYNNDYINQDITNEDNQYNNDYINQDRSVPIINDDNDELGNEINKDDIVDFFNNINEDDINDKIDDIVHWVSSEKKDNEDNRLFNW